MAAATLFFFGFTMATPRTTPADMLVHYDERDIRELVLDDASDPNAVDPNTDARLLQVISAAEGKVVSYLLRGGRYTTDDINALAGCDLDFFKNIVCDVAMLRLLMRRSDLNPGLLKALRDIVDGYLKDLQSGVALLGSSTDEIADAGRPSVDGPTLSELNQTNWWRTRAGGKYFTTPVQPEGRNI